MVCGGRLQAQTPLAVIVLQERGQPQPGLVSALQIQLTGSWALQVREVPPGAEVSARLQQAGELARAEQTLAVVWAELGLAEADGSRQALVYVVGQRDGRALVQVVRVPGGHGPDLERSLALKIGEILEELSSQSGEARLLRASSPPSAAEPIEPAPAPLRQGLVVAAGARFAFSGSGFGRSGLGLEVGPSARRGRLLLRVGLGIDWFPQASVRRAGAEVSVSELTPLLRAAGEYELGRLSLAARSGIGYELVRARGQTPNGRIGAADGGSAACFLGLGLAYELGFDLWLAAAGDLVLQASRQRFQVNGRDEVDLGRVQARWSIDLVYRSP
jgi:hypothetical protein